MSGRMRAAPRDWGQASRVVAQAYFPHELRPVGGAHEPRLTLRTLDLGPVLIGHVGWGADVAIECDYPSAYEVNMPITGHLESRGRFGELTSVVGQGTVFR
ncbi:MAG TPA: AraC family transcriptional regulator, partial [Nocardioides sp.]